MTIREIRNSADLNPGELNALLTQLNRELPALAPDAWQRVLESPNTIVVVAFSDGPPHAVGMGALAWYRVASGAKGWIEDVVVAEGFRGRGIGSLVVGYLIDRARELGMQAVYLTSNPQRQAANRLYQRLGFVRRDTNCYKLDL